MTNRYHTLAICMAGFLAGSGVLFAAEDAERTAVKAAMRKAATFYRTQVAKHGGYVYYYSPDLKQRLGDDVAIAPLPPDRGAADPSGPGMWVR